MHLKVVITGGPGTGKSTVISSLERLQFACMPEVSRTVTREAQRRGVDQLFLQEPLPELYRSKSMELRYTRVFMMPPWEKIYRTDNERYESFEQSLRIYAELKKAYTSLGYEFEIIPEASVDNRVEFILNRLGI